MVIVGNIISKRSRNITILQDMKKKPICNTAGEKIAPEEYIRRRGPAFQPTPQAVCRLVLRMNARKAKFVNAKNKVSGNIKVQRSLRGDMQTPFSVGRPD